MNDIDKILRSFRAVAARGQRAALATLVEVDGTAFRQVGARMLIDSDKNVTGAISAGCIEEDIAEKAQAVIAGGTPSLVRYDTGSEKEILFGWGSGCDGIITVLVELVDPGDSANILNYLGQCSEARTTAIVVTVYRFDNGDAANWHVGEHLTGDNCHQFTDNMADQPLKSIAKSVSKTVGDTAVTALVEQILPKNRVIIFGGGAVSESLARFSIDIGWNTTIVDRRESFALPAQYPMSATVINCTYEDYFDNNELDHNSAVVITTHNFLDDALIVTRSLDTPVPSISILSSRSRTSKLYEYIEDTQRPLTPSDRRRLYAPAGLDLGGDAPSAVALSIAAQIQQLFNGRSGIALRDRGPVQQL